MKKSRREKIMALVRNRKASPAPAPGPACWACGRTVNCAECAECAERRAAIDAYAAQSPVTATANVTRRTP